MTSRFNVDAARLPGGASRWPLHTMALVWIATTAATSILLTGCGPQEIERVEIRGQIKHQGQPIVSGDVRFFPIDNSDAPQAGSRIENGRYEVVGGIPVGTFRVEVLAYRRSDGTPGPVDLQSAEAAFDQYLPARYNTKSELQITIKSGSQPLEKDFEL